MDLSLLSYKRTASRLMGVVVFAVLFAYQTGSTVVIRHVETELAPWYHHVVHEVYRGYPDHQREGEKYCTVQRYDDVQECAMRMRFIDSLLKKKPDLDSVIKETEAYATKPDGLQGLYPFFWSKYQLTQQRDVIHAFVEHSTDPAIASQFEQSGWSDPGKNDTIMDMELMLMSLVGVAAAIVIVIWMTVAGVRWIFAALDAKQDIWLHVFLRCEKTLNWSYGVNAVVLATWFMTSYSSVLS